jgi:hypothetical protein
MHGVLRRCHSFSNPCPKLTRFYFLYLLYFALPLAVPSVTFCEALRGENVSGFAAAVVGIEDPQSRTT